MRTKCYRRLHNNSACLQALVNNMLTWQGSCVIVNNARKTASPITSHHYIIHILLIHVIIMHISLKMDQQVVVPVTTVLLYY